MSLKSDGRLKYKGSDVQYTHLHQNWYLRVAPVTIQVLEPSTEHQQKLRGLQWHSSGALLAAQFL